MSREAWKFFNKSFDVCKGTARAELRRLWKEATGEDWTGRVILPGLGECT